MHPDLVSILILLGSLAIVFVSSVVLLLLRYVL